MWPCDDRNRIGGAGAWGRGGRRAGAAADASRLRSALFACFLASMGPRGLPAGDAQRRRAGRGRIWAESNIEQPNESRTRFTPPSKRMYI